jgi:cation transport ATPase
VSPGLGAGNLLICYDPAALRTARLLRLAEEALDDSGGWGDSLPEPTRTRFGPANATLGIAAVADFAVPALMPVSGVLLIGTNLRTFRTAWLQARRREVGLALLYTVIVVATLASGQFFASALMSWFFKFWHDRLRLEMAIERRRLLDGCLPRGRLTRLARPDGREVMLPVDRLQLGYQVMVAADEPIPADGRVVEGEAVVDERSVRGRAGASRKRSGDAVLSGSTVLAGSLRVEVTRPGDRTRASVIAHALVSATSPAAGPMSPTLRAETFANRAVGPTLATAGLGLLVGDLSAVGAILRPDYATGPGMALPLETLRDAALCSRRGIVVRSPDVFERLGEVDLIVLVDSPALRRVTLEVVEIQTRLPEADLLRYATSAFRHLADDRAVALVEACRNRRIHLLDLHPVGFNPGVTVTLGKRRLQVRDHVQASDGTGPLVVEADGTTVGLIRFGRSTRRQAASALGQIRDLARVPVTLLSDQREREVADLARSLGATAYLSGLTPGEMARFLRACRERGLRTAFVGDCQLLARAAAEAHLAVSMVGDADLDSDPGAVLLLDHRLDLLTDLWEISRSHVGRIHSFQKLVLVPNVFCVAGAFLFGFTGLTAVMISNLGTLGLYSRAVGSLRELDPQGRV